MKGNLSLCSLDDKLGSMKAVCVALSDLASGKEKKSLQLQIKPDREGEETHSRLRDDILFYVSTEAFGESNRNALTEVPLLLSSLSSLCFRVHTSKTRGHWRGLSVPLEGFRLLSD